MRHLEKCGFLLAFLAAPLGLSSACPPDLNDDGVVDGVDLGAVLGGWGTTIGDIDGNGTTDGADLGLLLSAWGVPCPSNEIEARDLAGAQLAADPWFTAVDTFLQAGAVRAALDVRAFPSLAGTGKNLYLVADRNGDGWAEGTPLVDVRGAAQVWPLVDGSRAANVLTLTGTSTLSMGGSGNRLLGVAFDLVLDADGSGTLSSGDIIDGRDDAGLWIVRDPSAAGPHATTTLNSYTASGATSGYTTARLFYPTGIQSLEAQPLVVISHGNGHQYSWYDFLGTHLASWGYVVISHQNNTVPGIETASTTLLQHTNAILAQMNTVASGAVANRINGDNIGWIGHSRGGEGVARGYDRLFDGTYTPTMYNASDIKFILSIAPTDFLGTASSHPHGVPFMLLYGAADGDVCGCPDNDIADSFNIYERATGWRCSAYLHGADHNDFNCCGIEDFTGPSGTAIGRTEAQDVQKGQTLAALQSQLRGDRGADEFLWRQDQSLRTAAVAAATTVVREFDARSANDSVVDDFQTNTAVTLSSSGGAVTASGTYLGEALMQDINTTFTWVSSDAQNGLVRGRTTDTQRSGVLAFTDVSSLRWDLVSGHADQSGAKSIQVRLGQGPRHTNTVTLNGPLAMTILLRDGDGDTASLRIDAYGEGVQRPYLRTGYGTGSGWQSEMETFRIPLADFVERNPQLDLDALASVEFLMGAGAGSLVGRLQLDDLKFTAQ